MPQLDLFSALQFSTKDMAPKFKSAHGGMPGNFGESYSAMANTHGGTVIPVRPSPTGLNSHD